MEWFSLIADAFWVFDKNYDGRVNFNEFLEGMDQLTCKFTVQESRKVF